MRVLILRPEREATALATALRERGHTPVIAPLFHLEFLHPSSDFAASLSACQAVLLTSANGARALAEASPQRARPILAVGDTTASTAEGLGFTDVTSASGNVEALAELVRRRLDPTKGPLLHASGREIAGDLAALLAPAGFTVNRVVLYEAREESTLPEAARAALAARAVDIVPLFSPRAAATFAGMVKAAGLADTLGGVTAVGISLAALTPVAGLPFRDTVAAPRPTRQSVLDEIDRLAATRVEETKPEAAPSAREPTGEATMSDAPAEPATAAAPQALSPPPPRPVRSGVGVVGAFVVGLVAAVAVLAGALASLPFWPPQFRAMWPGSQTVAQPAPPAIDLQAVQTAAIDAANRSVEQARRQMAARLDDLEKRLRALSAQEANRPDDTAARQRAEAETRARLEAQVRDMAEAEVRRRAEQLAGGSGTAPTPAPAPATATPSTAEAEKEMATLRREVAALQQAMGALDTAMAAQREESARQREQSKALTEAVGVRSAGEQKALAAARASALIGVAARLNTAIDTGAPFAAELDLLAPLVQGDEKIAAIAKALQEPARTGVPAQATLDAEFPAVAKAALADDLADDSYGARLLGKLKGLVSLRRVGEVPGDTTEARLARAETALQRGDLAGALALVRELPPQTATATTAWRTRAEARLAARSQVDQLAAHAVALLGAPR